MYRGVRSFLGFLVQAPREPRKYLAKTGIAPRELAHRLDVHDLVAVEDEVKEFGAD
jgi:hypothetical protein